MKNLIIPENYSSPLTLRETQSAVKYIKDTFQKKLIAGLNLDRITAPLIVFSESGINDDLNGVERKSTALPRLYSPWQNGREWLFTVTDTKTARVFTQI